MEKLKNSTNSLEQTNPDTTSTKIRIENLLTLDENFNDFLKILELYKLKWVARNCSNIYHDSKENIDYERKETTAEHISSLINLADYFIFSVSEFSKLDRLKVYDLIKCHDDPEIITEDTCISDEEWKEVKKKSEDEAIPILIWSLPEKLKQMRLDLINEYREWTTPESKFVKAVDKMDALVHELQYPKDRGPKWFNEKTVRKWFQPAFEYSPIFMNYFKNIMKYLKINNYF